MVEVPAKMYVQSLVKKAKAAARPLAQLPNRVRTQVLRHMLDQLHEDQERIFEANRRDVENVPKAMDPQAYRQALERVRVTEEDLEAIIEDFRVIIEQPDPIGEVSRLWRTSEGMQVSRVRVPLGVIAVVSDMGPRTTVNAFGMCLKTGNVCMFRGGTEWSSTNTTLTGMFHEALKASLIPPEALTLLDRPEPEAALELIRQTKYVDAVIPRGKAALRKAILEQARVPVIGYDGGVSHVYVDGDVDIPFAQTLVVNAKVQDPTASNAVDTVLVHQKVARQLLPGLLRRCLEEFKVEVRGCPKTVSMMGIMEMTGHLGIKPATDADWQEKYQGLILAVKIVQDLEEALDHIAYSGTGHTATIATRDFDAAMRFTREVEATAVLVNASTRVHSGKEFGLGTEIGTNITPFHVRGPLTLEALTTEKYVVFGTGQLQQPHPVPQAYQDAMMMSPKF